MKVNMTPNPLDVVTIHASQGDTEARQWEFELHNNGELIDTSDVKEQMVFKAYKGGTEQLLPENTSTPTTSPFNGDIRYPQGLLTDQEFTYRQSPTEEDGFAKITDIKGNTLVWNQLAENGNFADGVGQWQTGGANTLSVTDGVCKIQSTNTSTNNHHLVFPDPSIFQNGHTYLLRCEARAYGNMIGGSIFFAQQTNYVNIGTLEGLESLTSAWQSGYLLFNRNDLTLTNGKRIVIGSLTTVTTDDYFELKNICVFDLTQMGLDITDPSDFTSLFSLPYYSYNQGSLLSFNGTGIKTTGKNLVKPSFADNAIQGVAYTYNTDGSVKAVGHSTGNSSQFALQSERSNNIIRGSYYFLSGGNDQIRLRITTFDVNGSVVRRTNTSPNTGNLRFIFQKEEIAYNVTASPVEIDVDIDCVIYPQLEISYEKTAREIYTESTTSLPISTYFPTGMKSAGNVYDELTESKAITRAKQIIFDGSNDENWNVVLSSHRAYVTVSDIDTSVPDTSVGNIMSNIYASGAYSRGAFDDIITTRYGIAQINIFDSVNITSSSTTATWKAYLQEHPLIVNYGIATPTETSFTTASLVTENAEIPLSNEDGTLIGKCTEELSAEPGFHDAKIKLSDSDGTCYSNKLQLHVERSPQ